MQDEYIKAFEKMQMSDERKLEMRNALIAEMKHSGTKATAKRTALTSGQKAGIAAAAVAVTMAGVLCIPVTRNAISAAIKSIFAPEIPESAVDEVEYDKSQRDLSREAAAEWPEISENYEKYVEEQDAYIESIKTVPENYANMDLQEVAKYYESEGYTIMDIKKADLNIYGPLANEDFLNEGFFFDYWVGDNASGYQGRVMMFEASADQLQNHLNNLLSVVNRERLDHSQESVTFDELWTQSTDAEGNVTYIGNWVGPEPELKLLESDSARFMNMEISYNADTGIAVSKIEEGGGIG